MVWNEGRRNEAHKGEVLMVCSRAAGSRRWRTCKGMDGSHSTGCWAAFSEELVGQGRPKEGVLADHVTSPSASRT